MKAMLLAAGRGNRLKPITDTIPKPLVEVQGKPLIEYHIEKLAAMGIEKIIINHAYLGHKITDCLGDGARFNTLIEYSAEPENGGLETGGGIYNALPLLGDKPFIVINADIYTDYDFSQLHVEENKLAHLVLVPNPEFNPQGDFSLMNNIVSNNNPKLYTFTGIAVYHPHFFNHCQAGKYSVTPLLRQFIDQQKISGEIYHGYWSDVGTVERLEALA